jgi:small-conductance mechanosensitive channel
MSGVWQDFVDLLSDNSSAGGRAVTTVVVIPVAALLAGVAGRLAAARERDPYQRYYFRKLARAAVWALTVVGLVALWRPFAGRFGVVLGFMAAGIAFAMQEVIGAFAGWINILSGRIFRVGDRIEMGGTRGDVIDITPLRTKIMEIGGPDESTWVHGRQLTGRVVAVSNKATFTEPVFNYSASFDYLWEEISAPVSYDADWRQAAQILEDEARRVSAATDAADAIASMAQRYPVPRADVEPRVYTAATDNYLLLTTRFVVPVRRARAVKDELTRRVLERLQEAGITVASSTQDVRLVTADEHPGANAVPAHDGPETR